MTESTYTVSATEFTVNALGPQAMPAELPPQSGYTYAVDLHVNEADTDGVSKVEFNQPVFFYVNQMTLGVSPAFVPGTVVPMGYYDRDLGAWETSTDASGNPLNGKLIQFTASGGVCNDGTAGCPDIPSAELTELAAAYPSASGALIWRIPVMHFTAYDANWGFGVPSGTAGPPTTPPIGSPDLPASCKQPNGPGGTEPGSFIECLNQNVIESIPVADTPFTLNYASRRSQYSNDRISIPYVGGTTLSPAPSHIDVTVEIAGQRHLWSTTTASANQSIVYNWDRKDAYGRLVQGSQFATVTIAYFYPGTFGTTVNFDDYPGTSIGGSRVGREISLTKTYQVLLGGVDGDLLGFGGWTLSPAHTLDLNSGLLDRGDGILEEGSTTSLVNTVAGNHSGSTPTNGTSALAAYLTMTGSSAGRQVMTYGHDGSLYVAGSVSGTWDVLYRVKTDGTIYIVGGDHANSGSKTVTSGMAAVGAPISFGSIAVDNDDSIVAQDYNGNRIVRLSAMNPMDCPTEPGCSTSRTVSVIAGNGTAGYVNGLASVAEFSGTPAPLAIAPDRTIYIEDNPGALGASPWVLRRLTTAGIVQTLSGTSSPVNYPTATTLATLNMPQSGGLAIDSTGKFYIGQNNYVILADGTGALSTFAGGGSSYLDNGPAVGAELNGSGGPFALVFDSRDQLYIADNSDCDIHLITGNGIIQRYAGTGTCATAGATPDNNVLPATTKLDGPGYLVMGPDDGVAFTGQLSGTVIRKVTGVGGPSLFYRPSADGSEVYSFTNYEHTETKSALTGGGLYAFCYDSNGHLSKVIDEACSGSSPSCFTSYPNCITSISPSGSTVTITSRFGKVTTLSLTGGVTTSVAGPITTSDPAQRTYYLGYSGTQFDLLGTFADPNNYAAGKSHHLAFTADGLLTQDQDPIEYAASNAGTQLARTWGLYGWSTKVTTGAGRVRTLSVDGTPTTAAQNRAQERTSQLADGSTYVDDRNVDGSSTMTLPDGVTTISTSFRPDPRLGWSGKYVTVQTTNAGTLGTRTKEEYRTATLSDPNNPFSASMETDKIQILNTATVTDPPTFTTGNYYTRSVNYSTNVVTYTSPVGRSITQTMDSLGRVTKVQVPGLADVNVSYDSPLDRGVYQITQGSRTRTNTFYSSGDPTGQLHTITDSIDGFTSYDAYSNFDAPSQRTAPGLLVDYEGYDATGNLTAVRTSRSSSSTDTTYEHQFAPNDDNLLSLYTPPGSIGNTSYSYDFDRNLTQFIAPTSDTVSYGYDAAGRWSSRSGTSIAPVTRGYDAAGRISTETAGGLTYTYGYTGQKLTSIKTSGLYTYSMSFGYDSYLRLGGWALASGGTPPTAPSCGASGICYDNDELLTSIGSMTAVSRSSTNGLLSGTTVNGFSDTYTYPTPNNYGELMEYDAGSSGSVYKETTTRDSTLGGRIMSKTEVINGGTPIVHNYTYDTANRLWTDGSATYTYDNDGNRTDLCATYDVQDRFGCGAATYTADGRMTNDGTYTYTYDAVGNLLTASPNTTSYVTDSRDRRIRKLHGSTVVQQFVYGTSPYPIAQLDGSGNLQWTFYYGLGRNVPDYMVRGSDSHIFKLITDHLGSVRVVYDTTASSTSEVVEYDAWGRVTSDSNAGFQPFGFAGGIYDQDTGLVRFGARDYNPRLARWMTKDASRFAGGLNFYEYANDDPVNFIDVAGYDTTWADAFFGGPLYIAYKWWTQGHLIYDQSVQAAKQKYPDSMHNGDGDAYKHCLASCRVSQELGQAAAESGAWYNENVTGSLKQNQPATEKAMDDHNNACGIGKGANPGTDCAQACQSALASGELVTIHGDVGPNYVHEERVFEY